VANTSGLKCPFRLAANSDNLSENRPMEMVHDSPLVATPKRTCGTRKPTARSRVTNGVDVLPDIDGRSVIARRYRDISSALASDHPDHSEVMTQLIRRFAAAAVLAEQLEAQLARGEKINITEHALLCSTLTRLASRIGIDRTARDVSPTLSDFLRGPT
jgi:hypothetical protein